MPEKEKNKVAAEGALKSELKFEKTTSLKSVTDQILEDNASMEEEFKTALKMVLENENADESTMELPPMKKSVVNDRRRALGQEPLNAVNAIDNAWNTMSEQARDKAIATHTAEMKRRSAECGKVFSDIIKRRLGESIIKEVKRGDDYQQALLKGNLVWLMKRIRQVKRLGADFESSKALEKIQQIKQENKSCSQHLADFTILLDDLTRTEGWEQNEIDNPASLQAKLVKKALIDSLTLKEGQVIMASTIAELRKDATLSFSQMSTKLIEAEAAQESISDKINKGASRKERKALAATKKEEKDKKEKKDDHLDKGDSWRGSRSDKGGKGQNKDRIEQGDRGNRGGRGRGGRGNRGRGGGHNVGGRNRREQDDDDEEGGRDRDQKEDRREDDRNKRRGRGGGSRGGYGRRRSSDGRDRDDGYESSSWRGSSQGSHKRARYDDSRNRQGFIMVCGQCRELEQKCLCCDKDDDDRQARGKGDRDRKVGVVHFESDEEFDYEEPYRHDADRRYVRRASRETTHSNVQTDDLVQFDTGADLFVSASTSPYLKVKPGGPTLSVTGITGNSITPTKCGTIGGVEAVEDARFNGNVAPGMALLNNNPHCGVLLTSKGLKVIDSTGMNKISEVIEDGDVVANGVAKRSGWYLPSSVARDLAHGTPTRRINWSESDIKVQSTPSTESLSVRVANRRRPGLTPNPTAPFVPKLTPAAERLAADAQRIRNALHPSSTELFKLLEYKHFNTPANGEDGKNAEEVYGPDWARTEAMIKRTDRIKSSDSHPPTLVGEIVSGDLHVLGGANIMSAVDHSSGYHHIYEMGPKKTTTACEEGIKAIVKDYNQHKHTVEEFRFDSEKNLTTMTRPQGLGVKVTHHPPGSHAVMAESHYKKDQLKYSTILNTLPYTFDAKKHPHLAARLLESAGDIINLIPSEKTGPIHTPYQLFKGRKHKLKPEDLVPLGSIVIVKDWNVGGIGQNKTKKGIIAGYNLEVPGSFWVYDPTTGRKPEREFLASHKHIVDHESAMKLVDEWDGFKRKPTLNQPLQPKLIAEEVHVEELDTAPSHVPEGVQAHVMPQAQEGAQGHAIPQAQEGVVVQVQEDAQRLVQENAQEQAVAIVAPEGAQQGELAAPQTPGGRAVPAEPPPLRGERVEVSQAAPQQEGELVGPAPPGIAEDLRSAFFTLKEQNDAAAAAELHAAIDRLEELVATTRRVNAAKKQGANAGTKLYKQYERENPEALEAALRIEIEGLSKRLLGHAVPSHTLSVKDMYNVVHTMVLLKEKFLPSGEFEKLKARLVVLGNHMKEGTYGDTYSPTLGHASLMVIMCIAAADDANMGVTDVPCAFPNTPRDPDDEPVIVRVTGRAAEIWCELHPEDKPLLTRNGHLLIALDKYLYGMKDAPAAFHQYLQKVLQDAGFEATISEVCLIKKFTEKGYFIAGGHVDDLLDVWKGDRSLLKDFENALAEAFGDGKPLARKEIETTGNYVGLYIERDRKNHTIYLSQPQTIEGIREAYPEINWKQRAPTPSTAALFKYDKDAGPEVNGEKVGSSRYLSKVMAGMYVACKTRPDTLKDLTELSSIKEPTERADAMVDRVLVYIYNTRHKRLRLQPRGFKLGAFGDAGFATHFTGYSQSGIVITLGKTPFFFKCGKQRRITLSSTDAEYETLTEICKYLEWLKGLLEELEIYHHDPIPVFQDNKSTITLATGPGTFKRSKQNLIRYQYVKDLVKDGVIEIVWISTEDMIADILTKVLVGSHFQAQVEGLGVVST